MRLFVAAQLPASLHDALAENQALLRASVRGRYTRPDQLHVTLAFLGEVDAAQIGEVEAALVAACAEVKAFEVELGELGCFGRRRAATLWQGFSDAGDLALLAHRLRDELDHAGIAYDTTTFLPHVTLMRKADVTGGTLPMPLRAHGQIEAVALFESELYADGPVYTALQTVELG